MELLALLAAVLIINCWKRVDGEILGLSTEMNSTSGLKVCAVSPPNHVAKQRSPIECSLLCQETPACSRFNFRQDSGACEMYFCRYGLSYSTCDRHSVHFQINDAQTTAIPSTDDFVCGVQLAAWSYMDTCYQGYIMTSGGSYYATIPDYVRGMNTGELDPCTCTLKNTNWFDTYDSSGNTDAFVSYMTSVSNGTVVIGVCADNCLGSFWPAFAMLQTYGIDVSTLDWEAKFYFVLRIGYPQSTVFGWSNSYMGSLIAVVQIEGLTDVKISLISSENC